MPPKKTYQSFITPHVQPTTSTRKRRAGDSDTNDMNNTADTTQRMIQDSKEHGYRVGNREVAESDDIDIPEDNPEEQALDDTKQAQSGGKVKLTKSGKQTQAAVNRAKSKAEFEISRGTIRNVGNQLPVAERVHRDRIRLVAAGGDKVEFDHDKVTDTAISNSKLDNSKPKTIVYWMQRDQRHDDNWALLYAQELAIKHNCTLYVVFSLVPTFLAATYRHYHFMLTGLEECDNKLKELNIPFYLLLGEAKVNIPKFVADMNTAIVVTDFNPLRISQMWQSQVFDAFKEKQIPLICVDAHNVVPCWRASNKLEIGARTLRPKIHKLLPEFLHELPPLQKQSDDRRPVHVSPAIDWPHIHDFVQVDRSVVPVDWMVAGPTAAKKILGQFTDKRINKYAEKRNDPSFDSVSNLSPYLHFGQLSPQRAIIAASRDDVKKRNPTGSAAFVEEALVRRELSDNWCYYNQAGYDKLSGTYEWARLSLEKHSVDPRPEKFTLGELEFAVTYDPLWNAAELQAVKHGKIHGYMRMYWAKKVLEWTDTPELALEYTIYLNDRYSIDGRDPNGYVGCMWSIVGVHDRGWTERPVFGKIRYMNYNGCRRKFDVDKFISAYPEAVPGTPGFKANQEKAKQFDENYQKHKPNLEQNLTSQAMHSPYNPEPNIQQDGTHAYSDTTNTPASYIGAGMSEQPPQSSEAQVKEVTGKT